MGTTAQVSEETLRAAVGNRCSTGWQRLVSTILVSHKAIPDETVFFPAASEPVTMVREGNRESRRVSSRF
jgi:hypothetical protein